MCPPCDCEFGNSGEQKESLGKLKKMLNSKYNSARTRSSSTDNIPKESDDDNVKMEITPNELQEIITLARKSRVKNVNDIIEQGKGSPQDTEEAAEPSFTAEPNTSGVSTEFPILDTDNSKNKSKKGDGLSDTVSPAVTKDGQGNQVADPLKKSPTKGNRWRDRALIGEGGKLIDILMSILL